MLLLTDKFLSKKTRFVKSFFLINKDEYKKFIKNFEIKGKLYEESVRGIELPEIIKAQRLFWKLLKTISFAHESRKKRTERLARVFGGINANNINSKYSIYEPLTLVQVWLWTPRKRQKNLGIEIVEQCLACFKELAIQNR